MKQDTEKIVQEITDKVTQNSAHGLVIKWPGLGFWTFKEDEQAQDFAIGCIEEAIREALLFSEQKCSYELRPFVPEVPIGNGLNSLDEVVAKGAKCVHVEQMADNHYWMGIDLYDGTNVHVNFITGRAPIKCWAEVEEPDSAPSCSTTAAENNQATQTLDKGGK